MTAEKVKVTTGLLRRRKPCLCLLEPSYKTCTTIYPSQTLHFCYLNHKFKSYTYIRARAYNFYVIFSFCLTFCLACTLSCSLIHFTSPCHYNPLPSCCFPLFFFLLFFFSILSLPIVSIPSLFLSNSLSLLQPFFFCVSFPLPRYSPHSSSFSPYFSLCLIILNSFLFLFLFHNLPPPSYFLTNLSTNLTIHKLNISLFFQLTN